MPKQFFGESYCSLSDLFIKNKILLAKWIDIMTKVSSRVGVQGFKSIFINDCMPGNTYTR